MADVFRRLLLQVVIEGFKSYKDQTTLDPFSNKVNVIGAGGRLPLSLPVVGGCCRRLSSPPWLVGVCTIVMIAFGGAEACPW